MEQYSDMLPQEQQQEQSQELYPEQQSTPTNPKGKFSFVWGIVSCAVSLVLYILSILSVIPIESMHVISYVCLTLGIGFLILSIFTLIAGIKGIHTNPRTKAIIGTAFSGQNILVFFIIIIISIISICTHSTYDSIPFGNCQYEHFNDYDDIYDDLYDNDDY